MPENRRHEVEDIFATEICDNAEGMFSFPDVDQEYCYTFEECMQDILQLVHSPESDYHVRPGIAPYTRDEKNQLKNVNLYHNRPLPQSEAFKLAFEICGKSPKHLNYLHRVYDYVRQAQHLVRLPAYERRLENHIELVPFDTEYTIKTCLATDAPAGFGRFRAQIFFSHNPVDPDDTVGLSISLRRIIPTAWPPTFLNFNSQALRLTQAIAGRHLRRGLVLIVGGTSQGKNTSLTAILEMVNERQSTHIVTFENPIEYSFTNHKSYFTQIRIGEHVPTFTEAALNALRQDPDILVVGELRETESARLAISYAGTGHLVFATMHADNSFDAIERLADLLSPSCRDPYREIANKVEAIIAQKLLEPNPNLFAEDLNPEHQFQRRCLVQQIVRPTENPALNDLLLTGHPKYQQFIEIIGQGRAMSNEHVMLSELEITFEQALCHAAREIVHYHQQPDGNVTHLAWISDSDALAAAERKSVLLALLKETPYRVKGGRGSGEPAASKRKDGENTIS